jgi:hypothetical protein
MTGYVLDDQNPLFDKSRYLIFDPLTHTYGKVLRYTQLLTERTEAIKQ